jgi:ribosomal protein S18 acetylase RimI-like enzyme
MTITGCEIDLGLPGYAVRCLTPADSQAIQTLYEKCLDYMLLVDGHPAGVNAGAEAFQDVPQGRSPDDKLILGILDRQGELVGLLDALQHYPDETTWWIGLLLFTPAARSQGLGERVVQGFAGYVQSNGGQAIMLGVVEDNPRAYQFWQRMGFETVHKTEPRQFGDKIQVVNVMRRILAE